MAAREHALAILKSALQGGEHSELFKITESYRPGAEGREKIEQLIRTVYSLLRDLVSSMRVPRNWFGIRILARN